jgi:predicted CXXCH cytochrome family protein
MFAKQVVHKVLQTDPCWTCHQPHGSDKRALLSTDYVSLYLSCHGKDRPSLKKIHRGYPVERSFCQSCHNPHSSMQEALLKTSAHPMKAGAECEKCHYPPAAPAPFETMQKGSPLCYGCHDISALRDEGDIEHEPFTEGKCDSCHIPHASENPKLLARRASTLCTECHTDQGAEVAVQHEPVESREGCLSCHAGHGAKHKKLLSEEEAVICYSCHGKTKDDGKKINVHAPFRENSCSICHNAHGSGYRAILKDSMDIVCYSCHPDAEARFIKNHTHRPVIEAECFECHASHGSDKKALLLTDSNDPRLCADCHKELMKMAEEASSHPLFKAGKCLTCHDVHGSSIFGMLVQKEGGLCFSCHDKKLGEDIEHVASTHAPVSEGQCTVCHSLHKAQLEKLLLKETPGLCLSCHRDLKQVMSIKDECGTGQIKGTAPDNTSACTDIREHLHDPSSLGKCLTCHKPHIAKERALLAAPVQLLCSECHDYKEDAFKTGHLGIDPFFMDCRKCHAPHASKDPMFFKENIHDPFQNRGCGECHIVDKP